MKRYEEKHNRKAVCKFLYFDSLTLRSNTFPRLYNSDVKNLGVYIRPHGRVLIKIKENEWECIYGQNFVRHSEPKQSD